MHGTKELKKLFEKADKDNKLKKISSIREDEKNIVPKFKKYYET